MAEKKTLVWLSSTGGLRPDAAPQLNNSTLLFSFGIAIPALHKNMRAPVLCLERMPAGGANEGNPIYAGPSLTPSRNRKTKHRSAITRSGLLPTLATAFSLS
jgi:hypothetical protein